MNTNVMNYNEYIDVELPFLIKKTSHLINKLRKNTINLPPGSNQVIYS